MKNKFATLLIILSIWILVFYTRSLYSNNTNLKNDISNILTQNESLDIKIKELSEIQEVYKQIKIENLKSRSRWNTSEVDKYINNLSEDEIIKILTDNEEWIIITEMLFKKEKTLTDNLWVYLIDVEYNSRNIEEIKSFLDYITWDWASKRFFVNNIKFENKKDTSRDLIEVKMQIWTYIYE